MVSFTFSLSQENVLSAASGHETIIVCQPTTYQPLVDERGSIRDFCEVMKSGYESLQEECMTVRLLSVDGGREDKLSQ